MKDALDIQVKGIVQGVGFRPFVYRLAKKYLVSGWVLNAADGVLIHAEGEGRLLDEFVLELAENPPAAAQVDEVELHEVPLQDCDGFEIRFSDEGEVERTTLVSPDLATCADCVRELFNPNDRRYRYPFINCTNCGPRFTIIEGLPYDRAATSMRTFPMCGRCAAEYADPLDRRFHAQPDACFECGPHISWREHEGGRVDAPLGEVRWGVSREESDAILARAVELLRAGKVVAVKGLGGFHLVCDAENPRAVELLRTRKRRFGKAFAVMMPDVASVRRVCRVNRAEEAVLCGSQRPIVLLRKLPGAAFAPKLADALPELGVMLPYTPVQHLLMHDFAEAGGTMLVMTSGNLHDESIVTDDGQAYERLFAVVDGFLGNDRPIRARYDDSVVRVIAVPGQGDRGGEGRAGAEGATAVQFIRRARGYAPVPLQLDAAGRAGTESCGSKPSSHGEARALGPAHAPSIFAAGPEQKNTFTLTRVAEAFVSQHIGDMENADTFDAWLQAKRRYEELFQVEPSLLACDLHPEYLTTKWAREQHERLGLPLAEVQHHHAHVAAAMAEHGLEGPVCGIAFDGTGYGVDGAIWGGEVLLCNLSAFERLANFAYVPMPGGAAAVRNPLRMAYGALWAFDLLDHPAAQRALAPLGDAAEVLGQMIEQGINTPYTSSVGRLFDAASALLGICTEPSYEGEPAILLEAALPNNGGASDAGASSGTPRSAARPAASCAPLLQSEYGLEGVQRVSEKAPASEAPSTEGYSVSLVKNTATEASTAQDTSVVLLDAAPAFEALLDDLAAGVPVPQIAQRFHDAFAGAVVQAAELARVLYGIQTVVLTGGVFMNRYLVEHSLAALSDAGFTTAVNRDLPPNDGCVSFGQAVVAQARLSQEQPPTAC